MGFIINSPVASTDLSQDGSPVVQHRASHSLYSVKIKGKRTGVLGNKAQSNFQALPYKQILFWHNYFGYGQRFLLYQNSLTHMTPTADAVILAQLMPLNCVHTGEDGVQHVTNTCII